MSNATLIEQLGLPPRKGDGPITRRDLFAARAPEVPAWFEPVMPTPCPQSIWMDEDRTTIYDTQMEAERHCGDCYIDASHDDITAWKQRHRLERMTQWPWYWADEVLKRSHGR